MTASRLYNRAIIRISPEDDSEIVRDFLQSLITNDVSGELPVWAGLLTAQGKALFDFIVWPDGKDLLLDCEAETADSLAKRLALYRLRRKLSIRRDNTLAVHWRRPSTEGSTRDPRHPLLGERWITIVSNQDTPADDQWLAHRLSLGVAEGQSDLGNGETLWLECNAVELHGVSFTKGCYIGQENTARMNWRNKVNKRLIVVPLTQSNSARQRKAYPELGYAVDYLRVEDITPELRPSWLQPA